MGEENNGTNKRPIFATPSHAKEGAPQALRKTETQPRADGADYQRITKTTTIFYL